MKTPSEKQAASTVIIRRKETKLYTQEDMDRAQRAAYWQGYNDAVDRAFGKTSDK